MLTFITIVAIFAISLGAVLATAGAWEHPETL
jgi:hypothetical protein